MEEAILRWFQGLHSPWLDGFFVGVTMLGEEYFYLLVIAVVYWCFSKRFALGLGFLMLLSALVNGALKEIVGAARPFESLDLRVLRKETATGSSFPSGHTQSVAAFFSYLTMQASRRWLGAAFGITVLVAMSRLYLGVHWPKDVIFGAFLGLLMAGLVGVLYRWIPSQVFAAGSLVIGCAAALLWSSHNVQVAAGGLIGLSLGHLYEAWLVDFAPSGTVMSAVGRIVFGTVVTAVFYVGTKWLIPEMPLLRYMIVVFVITGLVPTVFTKQLQSR